MERKIQKGERIVLDKEWVQRHFLRTKKRIVNTETEGILTVVWPKKVNLRMVTDEQVLHYAKKLVQSLEDRISMRTNSKGVAENPTLNLVEG